MHLMHEVGEKSTMAVLGFLDKGMMAARVFG